MASFISASQPSTSILLHRFEKVSFWAAKGPGFDQLKFRVYGRDFTAAAPIGPPAHVVCSTSSRSRDPSIRRNNRSPNRNSGASKAVSILPGDMKLLMDLQEFISSAELPPHQVPSTRELARRGRQDLANAVRRRGEKAVSQLLSNPNFLSSSGTTKQVKPIQAAGINGISKGGLKPEVVLSPSVQPQASTDAPQATDLVPQTYTGLLPPHYEASAERRPSNVFYQNDHEILEDSIEVIDLGSSSMQHDRSKSDQGLPRTLDVAKVSEVTAAFEDSDNDDDTELFTYEVSSDDGDKSWARPKTFKNFERSGETEAWQSAANLRSKLIAFLNKPAEQCMSQPRSDSEAIFKIMAKRQESERVVQQGEQEQVMLSSFRGDSASEIARLSALLHAKEMENLRISRELEEAKAMLALVRAKHSSELAQANQVAVEQDLRLHAAEQALHSLKLTQVDWWGEGNRVELAGSFNGWQHHAYLLPDLSSKASKLPGTRGPLLWRIELWLYPGVYEIKFIVDGKWMLDDRREVIQGHMGENNLLIVEA